MRLLRICCATGSARPCGNAVLASCGSHLQPTEAAPVDEVAPAAAAVEAEAEVEAKSTASAVPKKSILGAVPAELLPASRKGAQDSQWNYGARCVHSFPKRPSPCAHYQAHANRVQTGFHTRRTSACVHTGTSFEMHAACHATCHLA
jgi:hypothetical protein